MLRYVVTALAVFMSASLLAQPNQYITDKLYAPVRSEKSEKGKTLHNGLESGTTIEVLERDETSGYARIRTGDNLEGWIRLQYISDSPVAGVQLEQANAQIAELMSQKLQLEEQLTSIKQICSSQIDAHERNIELVKQNQLLISEKEVLQTDNERLKDRNSQTWFLYGGLMVVLSSIMAALLPRIGKKRRNDGWR